MVGKIKIDFQHSQAAHCESGVTASLLNHCGIEISEALAFGIGAGYFFCYMPFIRLNHLPMTSFRFFPGVVFKRVAKRLGIKAKIFRFFSPEKAMDALDSALANGFPVGVMAGVYWLPFFPPALRFHFNAHNIVVYGKEDNDYFVSDSVLDHPVVCSRDALTRARFARGPLAPKGNMYYLVDAPANPDIAGGVVAGIKEVCSHMLSIPFPLCGVKGIRYLANRVRTWPRKLGEKQARLYLGQVIRMQEEIGTGGAGFRFIYAAFLQEAAAILAEDCLLELSREMTAAGNRWREFALLGVRNCKGRASSDESYSTLAEILLDCAHREERIFRKLRGIIGRPLARVHLANY